MVVLSTSIWEPQGVPGSKEVLIGDQSFGPISYRIHRRCKNTAPACSLCSLRVGLQPTGGRVFAPKYSHRPRKKKENKTTGSLNAAAAQVMCPPVMKNQHATGQVLVSIRFRGVGTGGELPKS